MTMVATRTNVSVIPCFRYRDAPAAIDWLCEAFGFERHLVVPGASGKIAHAELTLGGAMIMLGSADDSEFGRLMSPPGEPGGVIPQCVCVVVADPDAAFERARAAGATIVSHPRDESYGGRSFACRDPEGHLWGFGSYDPHRGS